MRTSRISTDFTVIPHGVVFSSRIFCSSWPEGVAVGDHLRELAADRLAERGLSAEGDGVGEVLYPRGWISPRSRPSRASMLEASTLTGTRVTGERGLAQTVEDADSQVDVAAEPNRPPES